MIEYAVLDHTDSPVPPRTIEYGRFLGPGYCSRAIERPEQWRALTHDRSGRSLEIFIRHKHYKTPDVPVAHLYTRPIPARQRARSRSDKRGLACLSLDIKTTTQRRRQVWVQQPPDRISAIMPAAVQTTVDRLDKPSAYYLAKVCAPGLHRVSCADGLGFVKSKKRKFGRDRDERDDRSPEEAPEDPLKDATTLYVGNLWVVHDRSTDLLS